MSRLAKQAALRRLAGDDSDSDNDSVHSILDDVHNDVQFSSEDDNDSDDDSTDNNSHQGENNINDDDYLEQAGAHNVVLSRNNIPWTMINENIVLQGRAHRANILQPAPGLTGYSYQRLREHPISDSFHLFFSNGMYLSTNNFTINHCTYNL